MAKSDVLMVFLNEPSLIWKYFESFLLYSFAMGIMLKNNMLKACYLDVRNIKNKAGFLKGKISGYSNYCSKINKVAN